MLLLVPSWETWAIRIDSKYCWYWHASKINLVFHQFYLLDFPFNVSINSFIFETDKLSPKIMNFVFNNGRRVWWTTCGKSPISVDFSWYFQSTFVVTTFLNTSIKIWTDGDTSLNVSQIEQLLSVPRRLEIS